MRMLWIAPNSSFGPSGNIVVLNGVGAPVSGIGGTGAGSAGPGSVYMDETDPANVILYDQLGTVGSPNWHGRPSN